METDRPFYNLLPELYRKDKLLDAITAVFEEQYLKIEKTIDQLPETLYDPERTTDEYMDFLWDMFGLTDCSKVFSRSQKRKLLPVAYALQRRKGTRSAIDWLLKAFISDLCGHWISPVVMEYESWLEYECSEELKALYRQHFGGEDEFTVFIPAEPELQTQDARDRIKILLDEYSPADAVPHLVMAEPKLLLGENCYLGFSTRI